MKPQSRTPTTPTCAADPLYTTKQKRTIVLMVSVTATLSGAASNIYFPAIPTIVHDLGSTTELINLTVTCYMIMQGLSPTFWGAISDAKGRRPATILTLLVFLAACIALGLTRSYAQLLVCRCVQSAGSASTIAISAAVIGDVTTKAERGGYMAVSQAGSLLPIAIGPFIGGLISEHLGWRSVFWFLTIYGGVCLLAVILFQPETLSARSRFSTELKNPFIRPLVSCLVAARNPDMEAAHEQRIQEVIQLDFLGPISILGDLRTATIVSMLAIHYTSWQMMLTVLPTAFTLRYGTSQSQNGLVYLSNGIGAIVGTVCIGKVLDWDYARAAKMANDLPAEHRLRAAWVLSPLQIAGVLIFGWCTQETTHIAWPIVALFSVGLSAVALQSAVSVYLVDIHQDCKASASASLNLARCLLGAAGTAAAQPLTDVIGFGWLFTLMAGLLTVSGVATLIIFGQSRNANEHQ